LKFAQNASYDIVEVALWGKLWSPKKRMVAAKERRISIQLGTVASFGQWRMSIPDSNPVARCCEGIQALA
jgi:hypothetical protein